MNHFIVDAGPLVAWFCTRDEHHAWAAKNFDTLPAGALVCEAVLAEACHLAAKDGIPPAKILRLVETNDLTLVPLAGQIPRICELLNRYADTPMDFADACVVRLAEIHPDATVCTTDSHFKFFRKHERKNIPLLAPFMV
jgi:predicted nucleic acid-binding protein